MSTTLIQSFREIAEACPCRTHFLSSCSTSFCLCSIYGRGPKDGPYKAAPTECSWLGHASLRKVAGEMHVAACWCGKAALRDDRCTDLRRRLMEVVR